MQKNVGIISPLNLSNLLSRILAQPPYIQRTLSVIRIEITRVGWWVVVGMGVGETVRQFAVR